MVDLERRRFLQLAGGTAALAAMQGSIAHAAQIPAARRHGSLDDVEHIVVLMQENRSFEHYLGSLRGVRGFGEPHPAILPSGRSVWHQSDGKREILPFHPTVDDLGAAFLEGLPHSWSDGQHAVHQGRYDGWIPAKGTTTMAHLERPDAAFHYALADAFTVCDAYYCSFIGNTDPNRYYMWTGWTGNDGKGGGPELYNEELGYDWRTYPERLQQAGVSWKVYQDEGNGLDAAGSWGWDKDAYIGNYGDNSLLYFNAYRNAKPGEPLYEAARRGTKAREGQDYFEILRSDVQNGRLPQVSYIAAPEAFSEHSNWPTNYGAWYISRVLDALTSNPEVWSRTALLITYDENDGFFDHLVPPHANSPVIPGGSTVPTDHEFFPGRAGQGDRFMPGSFGMGPRVPMFVVSPWSTGGWVCSQTLDHTSIIRLMEERFGVREPQITPWRRAVAGDLTGAFDFSKRARGLPKLPDTTAYKPFDRQRHPDYKPVPPTQGSMPHQEKGVRRARPLGYDLEVRERTADGKVAVQFVNHGDLGVHLQARLLTPQTPPHSYTIGAGDRLAASWAAKGAYEIHLHGPNGFFRAFAGDDIEGEPRVSAHRDGRSLTLRLEVEAPRGVEVRVDNAYGGKRVALSRTGRGRIDTREVGGWYDVTVSVPGTPWRRTFAGHLENGRPSTSDPALGR